MHSTMAHTRVAVYIAAKLKENPDSSSYDLLYCVLDVYGLFGRYMSATTLGHLLARNVAVLLGKVGGMNRNEHGGNGIYVNDSGC